MAGGSSLSNFRWGFSFLIWAYSFLSGCQCLTGCRGADACRTRGGPCGEEGAAPDLQRKFEQSIRPKLQANRRPDSALFAIVLALGGEGSVRDAGQNGGNILSLSMSLMLVGVSGWAVGFLDRGEGQHECV